MKGKSISNQGNSKCKGPMGGNELGMLEEQQGYYG